MSLVQRLLRGVETRDATLGEVDYWMYDTLVGDRSASGETVNVKSALGLIPVWAAVRLLAGSVAQCPLIVYRGEGRTRERAKTTPQWQLLHEKPNGETPQDLFCENLTGHLNLWGDFFAEKSKTSRLPGTQKVGEMWPIVPSRVRVERAKQAPFEKRFVIDGKDDRSWSSADILHIPAFGYDGLQGLAPIATMRQELGSALAAQRFAGKFFGNDSTPPGILSVAGSLSEEAAKRLKTSWEAAHRGSENRWRVAVLEEGATWQTIGLPLKDLEFVAQNRFTVNQIARMFQVPPEMIGGDRETSMTYSNVETQSLHFVKHSVARWLIRIEQGLKNDSDLFPPGTDVYPEFLIEGLLRGDSVTRGDFYTKLYDMGAISSEEIRERENMGAKVAGDTFKNAAPAAPAATNGAGNLANVPVPAGG